MGESEVSNGFTSRFAFWLGACVVAVRKSMVLLARCLAQTGVVGGALDSAAKGMKIQSDPWLIGRCVE